MVLHHHASLSSGNSGNFALVELAIHGLLYVFIFMCAAFVARRNFVKRHRALGDEGFNDEESKGFFHELSEFLKDPIPFLLETSSANSDTVQYRAGLEARLYLHVLWTLMKLFVILAVVAMLFVLPLNIFNSRMSWASTDSFSVTTANGFIHPSTTLLLHTVVSIGIALLVIYTVYSVRGYVIKHARNFDDSDSATPPVQAFTVELQGLRVNPPVTEAELRANLLDRYLSDNPQAQVVSVSIPLDVTDVVDLVDQQRSLRVQLARYRQQLDNDNERPTLTVGWLSWLWIGDKVDAISYLEDQIADIDRQLTKLRSPEVEGARFGTGTAFVTFSQCAAATRFVTDYADAKAAARAGRMSVGGGSNGGGGNGGAGAGDMVRNANNWTASMAPKPEDIVWRNLRYTRSQLVFMVVAGCLVLFVTFTFIVTPIFFVQILLVFGDATIEGTPDVDQARGASYESYYRSTGGGGFSGEYSAHRYLRTFARLMSPLFILLINYFLMPFVVHAVVKNCGFRSVSSRNRAAFCLICAFMLFNVLVIPGLSLSGLDEFLELSRQLSFDQMFAVMVLYGSSSAFFVDYILQAALLGSAFYFVFHTTTPLIVHWASRGKERELVWELDFAYFYSSALVGAGVGIFFMVVLPLLTPFVALLFAARYYTDKWQLLTAHANTRYDPAPESTVSAVLVMLLLVTALAEASFASWLNMQAADTLAILPWITAGGILLLVCVPQLQRQFVTISSRWEHEEADPAAGVSTVVCPQAYTGSYVNPYMHPGESGYTPIE